MSTGFAFKQSLHLCSVSNLRIFWFFSYGVFQVGFSGPKTFRGFRETGPRSLFIGVLKPATTDGAIEDFTMGTSDSTVRIKNSSCLVFVSSYTSDRLGDFVSIIISKSARTAYRQETRVSTRRECRR